MQSLQLDNSHLKEWSPRLYRVEEPSPLKRPQLICVNRLLADEIGFSAEQIESEDFTDFINGSFLAAGSTPYASAYAGHQFGYFVPNLGDGRAVNLGKLGSYYLQLKGSGKTTYSRDGDGRAILGSTIREFLMSEMMYALGVPTTRALAMIGSESRVQREKEETAAIVLRASTSWVRFGSFEFAYLGSLKAKNLEQLANWVIDQSYPYLRDEPNRYEKLYFEISKRTMEMVALWQSIGFMHGVMNSDNMSIEGLTLDYGPYAMMEQFNRKSICNLSDYEGRYSFENQPYMAQWNLSVLAKVFSPITKIEPLLEYNTLFISRYKKRYMEIMLQKLGLFNPEPKDKQLLKQLLKALETDSLEYTPFFYYLSRGDFDIIKQQGTKAIEEWLLHYTKRLESESLSQEKRELAMRQINPKYTLTNSMIQEAIDRAEKMDYSLVNEFLKLAQSPFDEHRAFEHYAAFSQLDKRQFCSCTS